MFVFIMTIVLLRVMHYFIVVKGTRGSYEDIFTARVDDVTLEPDAGRRLQFARKKREEEGACSTEWQR